MSDLLPMPKHPVWRKVAINLYVWIFTSAAMFGWESFHHKPWHWGEAIYLAFVLAVGSLMENFDYYGWRDKLWPVTRIKDRD